MPADTSMFKNATPPADPVGEIEKMRNMMMANKIQGGMPATQDSLSLLGAGQPYNPTGA